MIRSRNDCRKTLMDRGPKGKQKHFIEIAASFSFQSVESAPLPFLRDKNQLIIIFGATPLVVGNQCQQQRRKTSLSPKHLSVLKPSPMSSFLSAAGGFSFLRRAG
ncbi:hypothetical protein JTE90_018587 [Oedothorax gibbosus]|uniref:Uncharacterized protein n=1 Tax=Oedothorax gibbosus TaxID=931172 RepID=A0AAV6U475_9ARAC|nr:hypothetical protein JTE90_018587 [Oedothorax gibbosus]